MLRQLNGESLRRVKRISWDQKWSKLFWRRLLSQLWECEDDFPVAGYLHDSERTKYLLQIAVSELQVKWLLSVSIFL